MNMQQTVGTGIKVGELTVISNGSAQGHVAEVKDLVQGQNQIAHVELLAGTSDIVCLLSSLKKPLPDYEAKRSNKVYGIGETLVVTSEEDTFEKGSKVVVTRVEEERIHVKGLDGQLAKDGDNWHWLLKSSVDRLNKNISESHQYNLASPFDEKGWKQDDTFLVTCDCSLFPLGTLVKLLNDDNSSIPYFKIVSGGLDEGKVVCRYARKMSEVEVFEDPCEGNVEVADELPVYNHQDTYVVNQDTASFHKGTLVKITGDLTNASSVTAQCVTGTAKDGDDWDFIPLHCLSKYHADSAEPLKESLDKILGSSYIDTRKIAEALVAEGFIKG